jgi:hypothetical protein
MTTEKTEQTKWVTVAGAISRWSCGKTTLYKLRSEGLLDARKLGRRTLFSVEVGDAFFASLPPLGGRDDD